MGVLQREPEMKSSCESLIDGHGRRIAYLRLAVTDRCNLRCRYCLPSKGIPLLPEFRLLDRDQLVRVGRAAVSRGIGKIRLTGGEPTCRGDIVEVVAGLAKLPGLRHLAMTTNGQMLQDLAEPLCDAGLASVNISLDSLRARRYALITRGGDLSRCLAGLETALAAGLEVKLNVVVMRGVNDDEVTEFVDLAVSKPLTIRFIEYMPTGCRISQSDLLVPADELLAAVARTHTLTEVAPSALAGPSRDFQVDSGGGRVGVIAACSQGFCGDCNRIRVTAAGQAQGCLFADQGEDLWPLLSAPEDAPLAAALARVARAKPRNHLLRLQVGRANHVFMSRMGG
jgi:cyclic pyranopterin phosphate synthase